MAAARAEKKRLREQIEEEQPEKKPKKKQNNTQKYSRNYTKKSKNKGKQREYMNKRYKIAIDAMGGDNAPGVVVEGALAALQ